MKNTNKLKLVVVLSLMILSGIVKSQININVNIGTPPPWGPAESSGVRFYYLPDIEVYYDVTNSVYFYMSNGRWIHSTVLPPSCANYNLYAGYKVMLNDYHGERPYEHFDDHRRRYPKGYNHGHEQKTYGEAPGNSGNAPGHNKEHGHGHGNHGHGHGHGDDNDD